MLTADTGPGSSRDAWWCDASDLARIMNECKICQVSTVWSECQLKVHMWIMCPLKKKTKKTGIACRMIALTVTKEYF